MRNYYIYYDEESSINYLYLFLLHKIAMIDNKTRLYNTIRYNSLDELTSRLNDKYKSINTDFEKFEKNVVSKTTLTRFLNSDISDNYFIFDKDSKTITIQNNFQYNITNGHAKFIVLDDRQIDILLYHNEKLLYTYFLYIKYYCGFSGCNYTDFTANQFFAATGYSVKAGNYKSNLSRYNAILVNSKLITIDKFRYDGKERNGYSIS